MQTPSSTASRLGRPRMLAPRLEPHPNIPANIARQATLLNQYAAKAKPSLSQGAPLLARARNTRATPKNKRYVFFGISGGFVGVRSLDRFGSFWASPNCAGQGLCPSQHDPISAAGQSEILAPSVHIRACVSSPAMSRVRFSPPPHPDEVPRSASPRTLSFPIPVQGSSPRTKLARSTAHSIGTHFPGLDPNMSSTFTLVVEKYRQVHN